MKEEGNKEHKEQEEVTDEGWTEEWKWRKEQEERRTQKAASIFSKCKTMSEIELHLSEAMGEIEEWRETIIEEYQSAFLAIQIQDECGNWWEKNPTVKERQWGPRVRNPERDPEEEEQASNESDDPAPQNKGKRHELRTARRQHKQESSPERTQWGSNPEGPNEWKKSEWWQEPERPE